MTRSLSIRALLVGGTATLLLAVLGAAAWIGFEAGQDEATELFDSRLATSARVLAALVAPHAEAAREGPVVVPLPKELDGLAHDAASPLGHAYETKIAYQVLDLDGRMLMRSAAAPERRFAPLEAGFSTQRFDGHEWRVFALRAGGLWVHAAERDDARLELSAKLALATVAPLIAGIPLLLGLLGLLMRYALQPLADLARRIAARPAGTLAPISVARSTPEIAPVVDALNALLARERRFTADAAHELRTPLAALKVHAQNAARAGSAQDRIASLELLQAAVDRSTRLAEQMLDYSKATAGHGRQALDQAVSLRQVLEDALDDVLPALRGRGQKVSVKSDPPFEDVVVRGDHEKLVSLARNLLENASRYAPEGSTVHVELRGGDEPALSVEDAGPGVSPEFRERVFESYFRIPGSPGAGSGLGLAIVREVAAQHGARVAVSDARGRRGARFTVAFPSARRVQVDSAIAVK